MHYLATVGMFAVLRLQQVKAFQRFPCLLFRASGFPLSAPLSPIPGAQGGHLCVRLNRLGFRLQICLQLGISTGLCSTPTYQRTINVS